MKEIGWEKGVLLYCGMGLGGYVGWKIVKEKGYKDVGNVIGGMKR